MREGQGPYRSAFFTRPAVLRRRPSFYFFFLSLRPSIHYLPGRQTLMEEALRRAGNVSQACITCAHRCVLCVGRVHCGNILKLSPSVPQPLQRPQLPFTGGSIQVLPRPLPGAPRLRPTASAAAACALPPPISPGVRPRPLLRLLLECRPHAAAVSAAVPAALQLRALQLLAAALKPVAALDDGVPVKDDSCMM